MQQTLQQVGKQMAESMKKLSPAEQDQTRKKIYEAVTGAVYRPKKFQPEQTPAK